MAFGSLEDIQCTTSLSSILNSEEVFDELKCIDGSSATMKNIYDRQTALNNGGISGGLSSAIMINNQYNCLDYAGEIISQYDACGSGFESVCNQVKTLAETQEFNELSTLKKKVEEKIESVEDEILDMDKEADDYDSELCAKEHIKQRFETKLSQINARIGKLSPSVTGLSSTSSGSSSDGGLYGPLTVFNTGSDNNDKAYGARKNVIDDEILKELTSPDGRSKWVLSKGKIGINGWLCTSGDKYYDCYNNYFTTKIKCKDGVERTVYMIAPSSGFGSGDEDSLQNASEPILYISEDAYGHKICYDKRGNAISYNNAMNILEISRSSNPNSKGCVCNFEKGAPETTTKPTPYCPTTNYTQNESTGGEYIWSDSKADANGNKWEQYSTKTFDNSEEWRDYDLSEKSGNYYVYSKDNGDAGRINMLVNDKDSNVRYYSVEQPDGSYLYYDQFCRPVDDYELSEYIKHLY